MFKAATVLSFGSVLAFLGVLVSPPASAETAAKWTGVYAGGNFGAMFATAEKFSSANPAFWSGFGPDNISTLNSEAHTKRDRTAFTGGGQIGYNWQSGAFVVGLEGDLSVARVSATADTGILPPPPLSPFLGTHRFSSSINSDWVATLRLRAGTAFDKSFVYVTAGPAFTNIKQTSHVEFDSSCGGPSPACNADSATSKTKVGFAFGGGIEYKLNQNWSLKGEYLHIDFGSMYAELPNIGCCSGSSFQQDIRLREDTIKLGLNYRF